MHHYPYTMNHHVVVVTSSEKRPQYQSVQEHQNQSNEIDHRHGTDLIEVEDMNHAKDEAAKELPSHHMWDMGTVEVPVVGIGPHKER